MINSKNEDQYLIGLRPYLSIDYLNSSWYLSRQAKNIEENFSQNDEIKTVYVSHRSYVLGSIILLVSFLEASINEFYSDISDNLINNYENLKIDDAQKISLMWKNGIPRTAKYSILDKYEFALVEISNKSFDHGKSVYQNVKLLTQIRNALVHFESEWIFNNPEKFNRKDLEHKFKKKLKGKFNLNPITGSGNSFFPDKCLGFGICKWGINSAIKFVLNFWDSCNVIPHYRKRILKVEELN